MLNKKTGLIALLVGFAVGELMAGDFSTLNSYTVGDVLVCFRNGGIDMVVDAGPISTFTNLTANQRHVISSYTGTQLGDVGTNGVTWSAFTWLSDDTLFATKARTSLNTQTPPWLCQDGSTQDDTVQRMVTIPPGAYDELHLLIYPHSTATAVIEEDNVYGNTHYTDGGSYGNAVVGSYGGNFGGKFVGNPENTTAGNFTTSGQVVRSDFYQMTPTSGYALGKWLGYFELSTNGVMTYVAYPSTTPVIKFISRVGNINTIQYKSGLYGTYTLRGSNNLTTPVSTWPAITTLTSGDTATHSITDTTTDNVRFYSITAQ